MAKWDLKRTLTVCLGGFWLLDGILQLQPAMFTKTFANTVLAPNLQNQPHIIASIVALGMRIWSMNPFLHNLGATLVQILIGVALVSPLRKNIHRFALWLSIIWGLIIWIFGEGFGSLATGMTTFFTGAPGAALLYVVLAVFILNSSEKKLPLAAGIVFILSALLNLAPMFWQMGSLTNLIMVDVLLCIGIFLILVPNKPVAWITIIFLLVAWWIGQGFGGIQTFPFGTATDPSSAPLLILFILPIFFGDKKDPVHLDAVGRRMV